MKKIVLILCFITSFQALAQQYYTRTGVTELMASVNLYDSIKIYNWSTSVVLDAKNGDLSAIIFVKAFQFNRVILESSFNDEVMESDIYPKATFKGKIHDFDPEIGTRKEFKISGELTIKGIQKKAETTSFISKKKNGELWLMATFTMNPKDFNIKIPDLVKDRVGRFIDLTVYFKLKKK
ncbi:YceI family protein [Flavobacteriaceae bacterium S356]|uniref:YceI family protein n=1 Tax=Asprobacillus argus TaxID=3076534 RepID=A0ABU3LHD4_9FLAO|nr:YceI family protein [Flavobacteriaceae bacterium S356]